jgi:hypothetical protein
MRLVLKERIRLRLWPTPSGPPATAEIHLRREACGWVARLTLAGPGASRAVLLGRRSRARDHAVATGKMLQLVR